MKNDDFKTNLALIRIDRGLSQSQLAKKSGVSLKMIQKYEQSLRDINKAQGLTLFSLARALNCQMEDLIQGW